ncbi:hypothetical protein [Noviherbaspirillum saxi]|nr:hypothetical protein [Noviherbaspirillum saxi]
MQETSQAAAMEVAMVQDVDIAPLLASDDADLQRDVLTSLFSYPYPGAFRGTTYAAASRGPGLAFVSVTSLPSSTMLMYEYPALESNNAMQSENWLDAGRNPVNQVTVGYAWRGVTIESSTLAQHARDGNRPGRPDSPRFDMRSARLSYSPAPNWVFRFSRGSVSTLDQFVPNDEVRRTALAATYTLPFREGDWQTTLAWGRNARKHRESTMGYLLESTLRFSGTHALFGRIEQVGSDGLTREDESLQRQLFKMNRVSLGYFYDLRTTGTMHLDVGALISRHMVPSAMEASYGKDPTAYMMFVRVRTR